MELGLAELLRASWLAGTLPIIMTSIPFSHLRFLQKMLLGFAKRGKIMDLPSHKFTVPQHFFLHFYIVAAVWTTVLLVCTWFYAYDAVGSLSSKPFDYSTWASHLMGGSHVFSIYKSRSVSVEQKYQVWRTVLLLLLMEVQVLRRLYETLYVFTYSPSARMHICGYLTGLFFYTAAPLSLSCSYALKSLRHTAYKIALFIVKDRVQTEVREFDWSGYLKPLLWLGWFQWIGVAIFMWGWIHQYQCHAILGSLRKHPGQASEYAIPHGDWFEIVSCPHYLAEIVIYTGLLVAGGGTDITLWLLFAFVVANLTFAAGETQRWYQNKFHNYPRSRKAILPFIY
ncbi:polyprenol reductase 2 [Aristolochia californica]|uniref:polyprenol reductase 2 n=1 Tax=Aristolochia californica TaxID=171875 RepID=UPI0035D728BC